MRRIGSVIAAAAVVGIGIFATPAVAHADGSCDEIGTYYCYETDESWGVIKMYTVLDSNYHEVASAQAFSQAEHFAAYMDVSHDGGATWNGWQDTVYNDYGLTYTDISNPESDGPGTWVRACINVDGYSACTPWH
jgi:hypothetical protein